ncbi:MAG: hypothetical protein ACTSYA_05220 [Candidatus Kariarchaeaceae archaeon]
MSLIISVLLVLLGIISYLLFYFGILVPSNWNIDTPLERVFDGSITSSLLIVLTSLAWFQRSNRFGYFAFGTLFLITAFWFYFITAKLNYPVVNLKVSEKDLFPSEILEKLTHTHKIQEVANDETQTSLICILPSLNNMFTLHAVKRILEQKMQQTITFTWHLIITEKPSETPLLAKIQEHANISILQDEEIIKFLYDNESTISKIKTPLFFILSSENEIQWMLNPKSMHELLPFDNKLNKKQKPVRE